MKTIASFTVNHDTLTPGIYVSRIDGDITTYDLRTRIPNSGDFMDNRTMHSVEHMFATYIRNSAISDRVIYFGPMGCQTGFYLLFDSNQLSDADAVELVKETFAAGAAFDGEMPGKSSVECGNYINLDTELAKIQCAAYSEIVQNWTAEKLAY